MVFVNEHRYLLVPLPSSPPSIPKDEYVNATLIYKDKNGAQKKFLTKLRERC